MADHPSSGAQQEADAAASKGCGMFGFLKKKSEDVASSENACVTNENKQEEKPSLAETLHLSHSSSSSSDEEGGENGEKKKKKKKKKDKVCGHKKEDVVDQCETEEKKGVMEKLPEANKSEHGEDHGKEKGVMEKMKDKLPGGHHGKPEPDPHHDDIANGKEKGFLEKIMEKLPGHAKHDDDDDDEKKK
uniref:Dehydrin ERD10 n=1 Tax=Noccaea caerulescens TaxID=107243 RepID=A0A1J3D2Q8_NOCCA